MTEEEIKKALDPSLAIVVNVNNPQLAVLHCSRNLSPLDHRNLQATWQMVQSAAPVLVGVPLVIFDKGDRFTIVDKPKGNRNPEGSFSERLEDYTWEPSPPREEPSL